MGRAKLDSRGFTLIATLLLLALLSGVAIGLLMMVNSEGKVGTQDMENNRTFHAAEGAIEKMTSDLSSTFQNIQSPTVAQITGLSALAPASTPLMSYPVYSLTPATDPTTGALSTSYGTIATGAYQGLSAQILPVTLQTTALGPLGDEVNMSRTVEVALIPVFQFGVFSDSDLSFFAGVNLDFQGRVHTNGDLFLSAGTGTTVTFHDKVTSWGNVVRTEQANGLTNTATNHLGTVNILTASQGCDLPLRPNCRAMAANEGSVVAGPTSAQNGNWPTTISVGAYNSWIIDGNYGLAGGTGASKLSLPFVNGTNGTAAGPQAFELIRRPPPGEAVTSPLGSGRLYNEAAIRVLLSDTPADLPGGAADAQNVRLANFNDPSNGVDHTHGVAASVPAGLPALASGGTYNTYFATASTGVPDPATWAGAATTLPADWPYQPLAPLAGKVTLFDANAPIMHAGVDGLNNAPPAIALSQCNLVTHVCPGVGAYPYYTPLAYPAPTGNMSTWNLLDGYLRVEYRDVNGAYHAITDEWLKLGFARGTVPPTVPGANPINPNAILIFQEPADRNANGVIDITGAPPSCTNSGGVWTCISGRPPDVTNDALTAKPWYGDSKAANQSASMYNWYPINFYDAREGEVRDVQTGDASCSPAGVMNAVELDVGNLKKWLAGNFGGTGTSVDYVAQNGYVLYFSDRRGMLPNPNGTQVDAANTKTGDSGLEDSINTVNQDGTPDGALQATPAGKTESPEDVNNNTVLDNFGTGNIGLGLGYVGAPYVTNNNVNRKAMAGAVPNPYLTTGRIPACTAVAMNAWISGARHALKLVDGSLGNLPVRPDNNAGGFTVGSENPVYIYGDYNTSAADPTWGNPLAAEPAHAAAAVIADAVTMLSNNWSDVVSLNSPSSANPRNAGTTYYRTAISAGKNINFPVVGLAWTVGDFGTDGGLHNFLRQLEDWSGQTLNYKGSMVSMYYSTYATGTDKNGGGTTYSPPARNYIFDPLFTQPQNLPPGTPMFRDIDNLSYRQSFTPHVGCY